MSEGGQVVKFVLKVSETTKSLLSLFDLFTSSADIVSGGKQLCQGPYAHNVGSGEMTSSLII